MVAAGCSMDGKTSGHLLEDSEKAMKYSPKCCMSLWIEFWPGILCNNRKVVPD